MWHVAIDGEQQGTVSEEELRRMVAAGRLKPGDLIWREGMAEWLSAAQALPDAFAALLVGPIGTSGENRCPFCGGSLEFTKSYGHLTVCEKCHDLLFLRRAVAFAVDVGAFSLVTCCFSGVLNLVGVLAKAEATAESLSTVTSAVLWLLGFLMKDSFGGRSPGKLLHGVRVIDLADGGRADLARRSSGTCPC